MEVGPAAGQVHFQMEWSWAWQRQPWTLRRLKNWSRLGKSKLKRKWRQRSNRGQPSVSSLLPLKGRNNRTRPCRLDIKAVTSDVWIEKLIELRKSEAFQSKLQNWLVTDSHGETQLSAKVKSLFSRLNSGLVQLQEVALINVGTHSLNQQFWLHSR